MSDDDCGCCEGVGGPAPDGLDNPPGLEALAYRVGTHASFFRTMMARLAVLQAEGGLVDGDPATRHPTSCLQESHRRFLLGGEPDAATALLDGWACIADVLSFYQERIANEGFLRTATEERSVIELGRLTGYEPRPGVAASVHLAFTVQDGFDGAIPERTRTQSLPRPEQSAQIFETSHAINARAEWNEMAAGGRATGRYIRREYVAKRKLQHGSSSFDGELEMAGIIPTRRIEIFLEGAGQNVQAGDVLLLTERTRSVTTKPRPQDVYRVSDVWPHPESGHTTLRLVPLDGDWERGGEWDVVADDARELDPFATPTLRVANANLARVRRSLGDLVGGLGGTAEEDTTRASTSPATILALIAPGLPDLREHLLTLLRTLEPEPAPVVQVMRVRAQVFGHAVPPFQEITSVTTNGVVTSTSQPREHEPAKDEQDDVVYLAGEFAAIRAGSVMVLRAPSPSAPSGGIITQVFTAEAIDVQSRLAYGTPGKSTWTRLSDEWWRPRGGEDGDNPDITPIRRALVYAQPEPLTLVGEPLHHPVSGSSIDLAHAVDDLPGDRLVIVEGERDLPGVAGIRVAELARVASSTVLLTSEALPHRLVSPDEDGDVIEFTPLDHDGGRSAGFTRVTLAAPLRYSYRRATVVVRGNVAHATHGETRDEILGSGDATVPEQRFTLRAGPRTWESAPTPTGVASSLSMRVSGVLWPEVPAYALPGPRDEVVRSRTLGDRKDELRGGDGRRGARFPTGIENLTARYRVGLGAAGNVDRRLINALVTRPIGVREVINPLRASGGADPDGRDEIRLRIPIAARSIDRLVSVADHADFALNFAGVDKAGARHGGSTVEVVIAGDEDVAIDEGSDLLRNLRAAFQLYGDPLLRPVVRVATPVPLVLQAAVRIDPRHEWPRVELALRERLYRRHGWDARAIGEPAYLSAVLEALQAVDGVRTIDVDVFGPLRPDQPLAVAVGSGSTSPEAAAIQTLLLERVFGLRERLIEGATQRRWSFAAGPTELLYFARSAPATVAFSEVVS